MTIKKLLGMSACVSSLLFGCVAAPDDAEAVQASTFGQTVVHGSGTVYGATSTGVESRPIDFSAVSFTSYARSRGALVREAGAGKADGTFTVPVAAGAKSWELETDLYGPLLAVGNARELDLSYHVLGRLDGTFPTTETDVSINVTGMTPWAAGDTTEIVAGNNGAVVFFPDNFFATQPAPGDTSITAETIDWAGQYTVNALVEAAKGDVATMIQLVATTASAGTYQSLEKSGIANGFTQTNGVTSTMTVAMSAVPQKPFAFHWQGAAFEAMRAEAGPGAAAIAGEGVTIDALPGAAEDGFYTSAPDLLIYTPSAGAANYDASTTYGNPYSTMGQPWDEFAIITYPFSVPMQLGTAAPSALGVGYQANLPLSDVRGRVVAPLLSPARNLRIGGKRLDSPQTGVGTSPTVRWDAPRIGHPTQYNVTLWSITAVAGTSGLETQLTPVAGFYTKDRSLEIPSTFITSGGHYALTIMAINFGDIDRTVAPFSDSLPYVGVSTATAMFTP